MSADLGRSDWQGLWGPDSVAEHDGFANDLESSDFDLDAEVIDEAGTVVARTHGRYQLRTF